MALALLDAQLPALALTSAVVCFISVLWEVLRYVGLDIGPSPPSKWVFSAIQLIKGTSYLIHGPDAIRNAYSKANSMPFVVPTETNRHVLVSSPEHIAELDRASGKQLSLHAAAKEILQPKYTYTAHDFEWPDRRGVESTGFSRSLKSLLTARLPAILPALDENMSATLSKQLEDCDINSDGYNHFPIYLNLKRLITIANSSVFFGVEISRNNEFTDAALEYMNVVPAAAEIVKIVPSFLAPLVAKMVTRGHRASRTMHRLLSPAVQERLELRARDGVSSSDQQIDIMQWLIDTSPKKNPWSVTRAVDEVLAVWFGSVPQLAITASHALYGVAAHTEKLSTLRSELAGHAREQFWSTAEGLNMLDGFIKESVPMSPMDAISCRRKALSPFAFSDGTKVHTGDWACVPQQAMWQDTKNFSEPDRFDPLRFTGNGEKPPSQLTEVSETWPMWGFGRTACPGRFYATLVLKLLLAHIIQNYDIKLPEKDGDEKAHPPIFTWRSSIIPRAGMTVLLKPRHGVNAQAG